MTTGLGLSHGIEYEQAKNTAFKVEEDMFPLQYRFKKLISNSNYFMLVPARQDLTQTYLVDFYNHIVIPELSNKHFEISLKPLFYDTIHFASAKGHFDDVIDRIDKAILTGTKNGSLPKLLRKYK